ncbi:MAG: PQQ-binding-like beta-propeller repeat protein [Candidatus Promineifilaceae bacterium]|nr:PQQ-binding-like beta-propeller repeat protein [Candidatus Promineifilaceae bacterium]
MFNSRRSLRRSALLIFIFAALLLTACGARTDNQNWPGLSTDGEKLFLANGSTVSAYFADTQELAWTYPAEPNATLLFFAAPSLEGDRVVFGDYGAAGGFFSPSVTVSLYAVENTDSGGVPPEIWVDGEKADDKIVAPPLQVGDDLFVGTADNFVLALDAASGASKWSFETGHSIWGRPAYQDGVLFVSSMDRSVYALDAETGEEKWKTSFVGAIASGPVLNEDLVYVSDFDSQIHALDVQTGVEQWSAPAENWVWASPTYADGVVYYVDISGNVFAVNAQSGEALWQMVTPGSAQTSPVVADSIVYVASEGESSEVPIGALRAFAVEDGKELWTVPTPAPLFTTPVIVDDAVVVAMQSEEAILIAFDRQTGGRLWSIAPPQES